MGKSGLSAYKFLKSKSDIFLYDDYNIIKNRGPIVIASSSPNTYADYLDEEFRLNRDSYSHLNGRVKFFYYSNKRFN